MMSAAAARTKGIGFANVRTFVTERFGDGAWNAVLTRLRREDRAELMAVLPVGWYPLELYARVIRALDEVHGYGDLALVVQLGRFEAERDLTTIHRVFLRLANPAYVVEKSGEYWRRFHDTGTWTLSRESSSHITGTLDDWGYVDHALCRELVGYMGRCLELVGAKNVLFEHPVCRARGEDRCFFQARWGVTRADVPASLAAVARQRDGAPESQQLFDPAARVILQAERENAASGARAARPRDTGRGSRD